MQAYNEVLLEGVPTGTPERSHENHGQVFYRQFIEVPRLSGTADLLPMLLRQEQLAGVHSGEPLRIDGQLRSFNNRTVTGRRLILTVYGKALLPPTGEAVNQIILSGTLCKPPVYRRTPLGRSICDLLLAVPRNYGRADYLPVIAWGQTALQISAPRRRCPAPPGNAKDSRWKRGR